MHEKKKPMTSKVRKLWDKYIRGMLDVEREWIYTSNPLMERTNARKEERQSSNSGDAPKNKG